MNELETTPTTTSQCIAHQVVSIYNSTRSCLDGKYEGSVEYDSCLQTAGKKMAQEINECDKSDEEPYFFLRMSPRESICVANGIPYTYGIMRRCVTATNQGVSREQCDLFIEETIKQIIRKCLGMVLA